MSPLAAALARLGYDVSALGFRVSFDAGRSGEMGRTFSDTKVVHIYVRSCANESDSKLLWVLAHEIGHAVDFAGWSSRRHADWLEIRGASAGWTSCGGGCGGFGIGAEDFAEVFAYSHTGLSGKMFNSTVAGLPSSSELGQLRPLMQVGY